MQKLNRGFINGIWLLSCGFWQSKEKWHARMLLAVVVALQLSSVYILVLYNNWQNTFYNTIQNMDQTGFLQAFAFWPLFTLGFLIIDIYKSYLLQLLAVKWRSWLTDYYLKKWLKNRTYYLMQIVDEGADNPDQRISEDIRLFVHHLLDLFLGFLRSVVSFCSFITILWGLSGTLTIPWGQDQICISGYMVWVAVIYAVIGSWLTAKIGNPLVKLDYMQQQYEADFRFSLVRLRENSESIAFYRGEQQEEANFTKRFKMVLENFRGSMRSQKRLSWLTLAHWRLQFLFPYIIAVPRIFSGEMQLGGLFQTATAFTQVELALSFFMQRYYSTDIASLAELQAVVKRLMCFIDSMERTMGITEKQCISVNAAAKSPFSVIDLDVELPNGEVLLNNLNLEIKAGDMLLITGASGCGKSTLLKTLAGIWPFAKGHIHVPKEQRVLFLPQKPYLPLGTIKEVLLYPGQPKADSDQKLREVMFMCQLGHLVDQLDKTENWSQILSLGEQQRIAFARAILQQPKWLFLDEATSALDERTEQIMYRLLIDQLPKAAIISVGHRSSLSNYHKMQLSIGPKGDWKLVA